MHRKISASLLVVASVLFLSGCSMETPEVSTKEKDSKLDITYGKSSGEGTPQEAPATKQQSATPPTPQVKKGPTPRGNAKKTYQAPPEMKLVPGNMYEATLKTLEGDIVISLHSAEVPSIVNNFVFLARDQYYDNTVFHRVMKGFMIQGGDPNGLGTGDPGYYLPDVPFTGEYKRGVVAMANAGSNTNGSQFFIMHADTPLPKNYVIFGEVISGMEVVDAIASARVEMSPSGEPSKPIVPVNISSITIAEKKAGE